ncbi:AMP-binding protein [Streptomyces sp. ACT015]|uniref:AMP-binding protein n=1 Tax=Streptomyces sp. ACT015 TaxID=3134807 RepID=UPI003D181778
MTTRQQTRPAARAHPPGRPTAPTLDDVFAHTADRHPSRVAIQDGWHRLTYGRAEHRAATLASALVLGGVQLGDPLVVDCENHRQALVAQLAVLKAGGVCVAPLEGPGGAARAARRTGARALLCSRSTYDPGARGVPSLALDDPATWRKIAAVPPEPALPRSSPEGGAHLLLAADRPDRLIDHRSWLRSAADRSRRCGAPTGAVAVDEDPMSGPALAAMWWAFSHGTTLHTAPWTPDPGWPLDGAGDGVALLTPDAYARHLDGPRAPAPEHGEERPSAADRLSAADRPSAADRSTARPPAADRPATRPAADHAPPAAPATVVLIGRPCPRDLVARHFAVRPHTRLWSEFAPTDGAVPWTAHELLARDAGRAHEPGAGSPVPPVRLSVRGPGGRGLPPGESGAVVAVGPSWFPEDTQDSGWRGRWTPDHTLDITAPPATAPVPRARCDRPDREVT